MSRAGQANEAGSVFRGAVATHLAVHGIRSASITGLELPDGLDLVRLDFETSDPTDDIRATFADGTRAYISAKREISKGRPLEETVAGWLAQLETLGPGDLLVIAGEDLVGPAKNLGHVLRRHRAGLPMETEAERIAFDALMDLIPVEARHVVLDRARILHLPNSTGSAAARDLLAALMDFAVEDRQGRRAVSVLADLFHGQAGEALGSGIDDWVRALNDAGVMVIADPGGTVGMRTAYRMKALRTYLDRLREHAGRLDLSLLADDLAPITIEDLIDGLEIEIDGERTAQGLIRHVRRWRRMLILGQPGSGKSVAMRELAAHCAAHPQAPLPIPISLPRLLKASPDRWTVDSIVDLAVVDLVNADQRGSLAEHLREALGRGRAIVICDGLDECGRRAPWVAQQLSDILQGLHAQAGFILTTRANAQLAAGRLGLPRVELSSPRDLSATVERVLVTCAEARVPEAERPMWLATRRAWIKDAEDQHADLLRVPLLAVLLALICAETPDADLPKGRATLLHRAVEQSVRRWELRRDTLDPSRPWSTELSPAMLLAGFVVLGSIVEGGATPTRPEALDALVAMLRDPNEWAMPPAQAKEIAAQVLRFWDEHVAVFVVNAADELTTRSKVFAEIATAMWASTQSQEELTNWLDGALNYTDSDGATALAAGLDPRVIEALLQVGARGRPEATLMAADLAARGITTPQVAQLERILDQLNAGAGTSTTVTEPAKRGPRNPPANFPDLWNKTRDAGPWPFVEAACLLALPLELRRQRTRLIAQASLDERDETIAAALTALIDASTDRRPLGPADASSVNAALWIPLPPDGEMVHESRRRVAFVGGGQLAAGLPHVALRAAEHLGELAEAAGERALEIAMRAPAIVADPIFAALARANVDTSRRWRRWSLNVGSWASAHRDHELTLLTDLTSLAAPNPANVDQFWSLPDLGDLLSASGYEHVSVGDFDTAFTEANEELRRAWLGVVADAYGLDGSAISHQADHVQRASDTTKGNTLGEDWFVASARPIATPDLQSDLDATLTIEQQQTLLTCMEARSDWIARSAATIAINLKRPIWDGEKWFDMDLSHRTLRRAGLLYLVAIFTAGNKRNDLVARASTSESAAHRYAAGWAISIDPTLDPDESIKRALSRDADLTVRPESARKLAPAPTYWTCTECQQSNDLDVEDCPGCDHGTRPGS